MGNRDAFVGAIDQGTTSTRFFLFDRSGHPVASHQIEHQQIFPRPGWVEHDPAEIWNHTDRVIRATMAQANISGEEIAAIGVTNQRETVVVWDRRTGRPICNAIVWQDTRTDEIVLKLSSEGGIDRFRERTGLPLATYFSGPKIRWLIDNNSDVSAAVEGGYASFGTVDSWILMNLTGVYATDVTNASRTLLMDIASLDWSEEMLEILKIPRDSLPPIRPSLDSSGFGATKSDGPFGASVPVHGILGDQHAALFGQACFQPGSSKNTYGTGCFLLLNTGDECIRSKSGLITTVAYQHDSEPVVYALEGSIAVAGALVQWLRDSLAIIERSADIEILASQVPDSGGVYFVPAFSGLFAPHWKSDARGVVTGLTSFANGAHLARAVLESTAFQTFDIVEAMERDLGTKIGSLKVDGGMVGNEILMQFQADILNVPVVRPKIAETTALGAAYAAGLASGFWESYSEIEEHWIEEKRWLPEMNETDRTARKRLWQKAIERSYGWTD